MSTGYILVKLFKVENLLPETNGSLKITNWNTGEIVYQKENAFDISGESEKIRVTTPDKNLSLEPQLPGIIPYGKYNVEVISKGFDTVIIEGISVFEGITSIENIQLTESDKSPKGIPETEKTILPDQQLVLTALRDKQEGPIIQPYVLYKPYIPQFIVVHLGSPNSYAENLTVGFIDYIKNVASSEIYPTWPEEALKANIHCQVSFALNRVYTEWYRNKGYSFQITNSTAYDQYFVKGRNIFENISRLVDEIFNEYIVTIGNRTPFFAQYCNGTTVTCAGLSQWGTVDLANAGIPAIDIIKYYFGNDKKLVTADIIQGIPESYPGTALRLNDVNENVRVIQNQLNRISKNFPAIPKISPVNGVFNKQTEDAVKEFQRIFNLTPDGIVGRATWYKISDIYVGVKRLAELNQEIEPIEPESSIGEYPGYILRYGSEGEKVRELQGYLNYISNFYKIGPVTVDGIFGNATRNAVINFQNLLGLEPDGLVGKKTWDKIYEVYTQLKKEETPGEEFDGKYPGYLLKYGSRGDKVLELQTYLSVISKYYNIPSIIPDGIFGNATRNAVLAFQKLFNLKEDGLVGMATWTKIYEVYKSIVNSSLKIEPASSSSYPGYVLKEGLNSCDIKWLQTYLQAISKFYINIPSTKVSGNFDKNTKIAVICFQKTFSLNETGCIGVNDWDKLISVYNRLDSGEDINKPNILTNYPGFNLEMGDADGEILVLQKMINIIFKNTRHINEINLTGIFDNNTKNAVEKLQKKFRLRVTGIVDEITWTNIVENYKSLYTGLENKYTKTQEKKSAKVKKRKKSK